MKPIISRKENNTTKGWMPHKILMPNHIKKIPGIKQIVNKIEKIRIE
jgi:hypothetical protein